jgi:hypothetical protein
VASHTSVSHLVCTNRLNFFVFVPLGFPLSYIKKNNVKKDKEEQHDERFFGIYPHHKLRYFSEGGREIRAKVLNRIQGEGKFSIRKVNANQNIHQGIRLTIGQVRWNGRDEAVVQGSYQDVYDDKSMGDNGAGSLAGIHCHLRKRNGIWYVVDSVINASAG